MSKYVLIAAVAASVSIAGAPSTAAQARPAQATWWTPRPGVGWQLQYSGPIDLRVPARVFNLDLFETPAATIARLHRQGRRVICYFSAGSHESWRPDATSYPEAVLGSPLDEWPGERWVDVRRLDVLLPILEARLELAVSKRCDAVDPDNVDGYANASGFPLSPANQLAFNRALARAAHERGLAVGLKNDLDQIEDLVDEFDFAVNEQCFEFEECDRLRPFVERGKPVYGIEYRLAAKRFCPAARREGFDFLRKRLALDAWRVSCR